MLLAFDHTADARNPAPPKKPWNGLICVNTNKQWFLRLRRISSIRSIQGPPGETREWMDETLQHVVSMRNHGSLLFTRESAFRGFLSGAKRISSIHRKPPPGVHRTRASPQLPQIPRLQRSPRRSPRRAAQHPVLAARSPAGGDQKKRPTPPGGEKKKNAARCVLWPDFWANSGTPRTEKKEGIPVGVCVNQKKKNTCTQTHICGG